MRLLFAISVASFCAVLWIALAFARRIERDRLARRRPAQRTSAAEFFEAGEFRTPRPMPNQHVAPIRARSAALDSAVLEAALPEPAVPQPATVKADASRLTSLNLQSEPAIGPVRHLWPNPPRVTPTSGSNPPPGDLRPADNSTNRPVPADRPQLVAFPAPAPAPAVAVSLSRTPRDLSGERKLPQSAHSGALRRVDLSHYNNEDMGDLTDPYTHIVRPSGIRRAAKTS